MTRFRDLLKPGPQSCPAEEQRRASAGLADAVMRSNLRWWRAGARVQGDYLLLAVAPYSQYDLVLLDLLDERLDSDGQAVPVYVANLQEYETVDQVNADFPGVGHPHQTPVALSRAGALEKVALGKRARDMAAEALGLPADELSRRVIAEAPSSTNSPAPRKAAPPAEGQQAH